VPDDVGVIHLRLVVPSAERDAIVRRLVDTPGVAHVMQIPGASVAPAGDVVECDVAREAANGVIEWLQDLGVHHQGVITSESLDTVVSDAAAAAVLAAPGHAADAMVWEELEARAREESALSFSFLLIMSIAAVIAGVGILLDSPVLIVGAMVVGPEYGPLAAISVAASRQRWGAALGAARTLAVGLAIASLASLVATAVFRVGGMAPDGYDLSARELTAFISHPDALAAVVAVLAGIVGMLSITEARSSALIGVLVSVTTIPAVANVGVAMAYGEWAEVRGSAAQLAINVTGLVLAGVATILVQAHLGHGTAPDRTPSA
jgi:uncharacterized hydrophobic protein (TIGR00271 family)